MKPHTPAERLIVAADFRPRATMGSGRADVESQVLELAKSLKGTGVYIKVNSALRAVGYRLMERIKDVSDGLRVFADLKLYDIDQTLETDGILLDDFPDILTVSVHSGSKPMARLKAVLPETEVLGITILTSLDDKECETMFRYHDVVTNVQSFARKASAAGLDGLICSSQETAAVRPLIRPEMTINTPTVRPAWAIVAGDDQNLDRIATPARAMAMGADRIVVGRPIVQSANPYDAVMRTLDEIASVTKVVV